MLTLIERGFFKSPAIKLSDGAPSSQNPDVQVLRIGKFNHPKYGEFEITKATLAEMKRNYDNNVRGVDVAFDYFHDSDKEASGWPTQLYLSENEDELWAKVDWTPKARQKLGEREIRYFSPDFAFQWKDPETGKTFNNVLFGGGLTNRPFVKDMAAIVAHENKGGLMNEEQLKELQAKVLKLSEESDKMKVENEAMKKKLAEMDDKPAPADAGSDSDEPESIDSLKKQLAEAKKQLAEYAEKSKKAEEAKVMAEKESAFTVMLSEGKVCAAQKDAFIKGDVSAFAKLAQPINLNGKGSAGNGGEGTGDREDRVLKLAEDKCKADKSLQMVDAIKLANKEIAK